MAGASDVVVDSIADVVDVSSAEVVVIVEDSVEDADDEISVDVAVSMVEVVSVAEVVPVEAVSTEETVEVSL